MDTWLRRDPLNGAPAGSNPPSVVVTFNAKRDWWLHLIGAFGAKLEQ